MNFPQLISFLIISLGALAQKPQYATALIPAHLKEHANAVIRESSVKIGIAGRRIINVKTYRAVTILNEFGLASMDAGESRPIKSIDAVIYDAQGNELKKIRKKDFKEYSLSEGYEITDDRAVVLSYTPVQYPFTIVYESEIQDSNTAFIPQWIPTRGTLTSVEKSSISIECDANLGLKFKEINLSGLNVTKEAGPAAVSFSVQDVPAFRMEQYSPPMHNILPRVMFGIEKFHLEGVDGDASSWENYSAWTFNNLLAESDRLTPETEARIKEMVAGETNPLKKAKIIYQYVQGRTRYVSIQLGIGGWKPMKAADVDRLGYGDCKALSNYTRALLAVAGVPSYYTIVYSGDKVDLDPDFVSIQGNHIILAVPHEDQIAWLECTSQTAPFAFQGESTADRLALMVKPSGGGLVRTNVYQPAQNRQEIRGQYSIEPDGTLNGSANISSSGLQFENRSRLEGIAATQREESYKRVFGINNLQLSNIRIKSDKDKVELLESLDISAQRYANLAGGNLVVPVNVFNRLTNVPQRYRVRNNPFDTGSGYTDIDEISIELPEGYLVETLPAPVSIENKFGKYSAHCTPSGNNQMIYKRAFTTNGGKFPKEDYEQYRLFREQVSKADNSKMVLVKI